MPFTTLRTEEMPSGVVYGYVLPNVSAFKAAGELPAPVVAMVDEYLANPVSFTEKVFSDQEWEAWRGFRSRLVAWMVREVDGERITLDPDLIYDPEQFPEDDAEGLFLRGLRLIAAPKARDLTAWAKAHLEAEGYRVTMNGRG